MTEALSEAGAVAETGDALTEQPATQRPVEVKPHVGEPEPVQKKSADETRSETVQKAIDKTLRDDGEKPKEGAEKDAKAKDAKAKDAKDAKADDDAEEAEKKAKSERAPDGKFKAKEAEDETDDGEAAEEGDKPKPRPSSHREAPSRFDDAAKGEWDAIPENTRGAVHRMQREMEQGIQKYKPDAEAFDSVRKYADMAKESGTDLKTALERYTAMEDQLRKNPVAGLQAVLDNLGLKKRDGSNVTMRDVAGYILNQKPDEVASRQESTISELRRELTDMKRQISGINEHAAAQTRQVQEQSVASEWESFKQANPNAARLETAIADFLTKYPAQGNVAVRERLEDALAFAEARNPDTIAAHTRVDEVAAQTRDKAKPANPAGHKSISGSPGGNQSSITRKSSRKEAIDKAMRSVGVSL